MLLMLTVNAAIIFAIKGRNKKWLRIYNGFYIVQYVSIKLPLCRGRSQQLQELLCDLLTNGFSIPSSPVYL